VRKHPYFAEWLNRTMSNRGISGGDIARATGVAESAVSRWRSGKSSPGADSLQKLASYLDVDPIRLAVTAGLLDSKAVNSSPLPLPEQTRQREYVREQIMKIRGLTDEDRAVLLEAYNNLEARNNAANRSNTDQ
jgi:transcriptional regulator with XRE-family HTH domain